MPIILCRFCTMAATSSDVNLTLVFTFSIQYNNKRISHHATVPNAKAEPNFIALYKCINGIAIVEGIR